MGVKKTIETDHFFKVTNISKNEQMDASELEGFLCWIFSDNPFKDQNINIKTTIVNTLGGQSQNTLLIFLMKIIDQLTCQTCHQ